MVEASLRPRRAIRLCHGAHLGPNARLCKLVRRRAPRENAENFRSEHAIDDQGEDQLRRPPARLAEPGALPRGPAGAHGEEGAEVDRPAAPHRRDVLSLSESREHRRASCAGACGGSEGGLRHRLQDAQAHGRGRRRVRASLRRRAHPLRAGRRYVAPRPPDLRGVREDRRVRGRSDRVAAGRGREASRIHAPEPQARALRRVPRRAWRSARTCAERRRGSGTRSPRPSPATRSPPSSARP